MTADQFIAVFGFLLSGFIVPMVKKVRFDQWVNAAIAIVIYALGAVLATLVQAGTLQGFDAEVFFTNFGIIFTSGTVGYVALWKTTTDEPITTKVLP